ncbi:MAG: FAD-dependent oxidoreductase [Methanobacteriaceae archaeon]
MENIVIGGGPAGRIASMEIANLGRDVTLIEKANIGGNCLNEGCMVIDALNDIAKLMNKAKILENLGVIESKIDFSYSNIIKGVENVQKIIRKIELEEIESLGVNTIFGEASLENTGNKRDSITSENINVLVDNNSSYNFDNLLISTGGRPYIPSINGSEYCLTNKDILNVNKIDKIPENLVVIGGGIIATEIANIFASFGSNVSILARSKFLKELDNDTRNYVVKNLLNKINIYENTSVNKISKNKVLATQNENENNDDDNYNKNTNKKIESKKHLEFEGKVILATGRVPNSEIGHNIVDIGKNNEIIANKFMKTNINNIYAAGDVNGSWNLTPVARMEGTVAARNMVGLSSQVSYNNIPQSISLDMDVSFLNVSSQNPSESDIDINMPGFAGCGSFWKVPTRQTGMTKVTIANSSNSNNNNENAIKYISSISPSSRENIAYLGFLIDNNIDMTNFDKFMEVHPSASNIYKILKSIY